MCDLLQQKIDTEQEKRKSISDFLEKKILPKLSEQKQEAIRKHVAKGISVDGAMKLEGVTVDCIRS